MHITAALLIQAKGAVFITRETLEILFGSLKGRRQGRKGGGEVKLECDPGCWRGLICKEELCIVSLAQRGARIRGPKVSSRAPRPRCYFPPSQGQEKVRESWRLFRRPPAADAPCQRQWAQASESKVLDAEKNTRHDSGWIELPNSRLPSRGCMWDGGGGGGGGTGR